MAVYNGNCIAYCWWWWYSKYNSSYLQIWMNKILYLLLSRWLAVCLVGGCPREMLFHLIIIIRLRTFTFLGYTLLPYKNRYPYLKCSNKFPLNYARQRFFLTTYLPIHSTATTTSTATSIIILRSEWKVMIKKVPHTARDKIWKRCDLIYDLLRLSFLVSPFSLFTRQLPLHLIYCRARNKSK